MRDDKYQEYRMLKNSGVDLKRDNSIKYNAGGASESPRHIVAKALAGKVCLQSGYEIDSEVKVNGRYEIDLVAHSHPKRLSYAIEFETDIKPGTKSQKLQRYVHETGLDDMIIIELSSSPDTIHGMVDYIRKEIGL